jgi:hypothetical protein
MFSIRTYLEKTDPLWGNSTSDESRPKWLRAGDKPANDLNECFADEKRLGD